MTSAVIKPVALPAVLPRRNPPADGRAGGPARRTLPLPTVPTPRTGHVVYGLGAVDCRGRVADRTVLGALGWAPGTRLDIRESRGLLVVRPDPHAVFTVTRQGHLRLPAAVRHYCGLRPGDRVLLAAHPQRDLLVVHPPAALDHLLASCHGELLDGDLG